VPGCAGCRFVPRECSMPAFQGPSHGRRVLSILLVSALHAALLFALLRFMVQPQSKPVVSAERLLEMIIRPPRNAAPAPAAQRPQSLAPARQGQSTTVNPVPSLTPPAEAPNLTGLGRALTGCAPENLSNLSPDERAHCPDVFHKPDETVLVEPRSRVKDPARRAAEMAAKNTPGRIPCTFIGSARTPAGAVVAPMVDPMCAIKGLVNGFGPLNGLPK